MIESIRPSQSVSIYYLTMLNGKPDYNRVIVETDDGSRTLLETKCVKDNKAGLPIGSIQIIPYLEEV